jgi:hypothetical protein
MTTPEQLAMEQGVMSAEFYLLGAIRCIDKELGDGYAAKHPELIAAFMQVAHADADGMVRHSDRQAQLAVYERRET